jgi:uncharacterized protein YqeY
MEKISERIESDFKAALKSKDTVSISTLRMLKAALHNKEIEKKGAALSVEEIVKIIAKQVQQHQESIEQFEKGNRKELAAKETKELEVLKKYLPEQLSAEEITTVIKRIIGEVGAKDKKDFGKVMKQAMAEFKGKADGKVVSRILSAQFPS